MFSFDRAFYLDRFASKWTHRNPKTPKPQNPEMHKSLNKLIMSEKFENFVQIRDEYKSSLIFGLGARLPIAIVVSFLGFRHQAMPLMQSLSHRTRAYTINADGFANFVIRMETIAKTLRDANERGELEDAKKW